MTVEEFIDKIPPSLFSYVVEIRNDQLDAAPWSATVVYPRDCCSVRGIGMTLDDAMQQCLDKHKNGG